VDEGDDVKPAPKMLHLVQSTDEYNALNSPGSQGRHEGEPNDGAKDPGSQALHEEASRGLVDPAAQAWHTMAPALGDTNPALHDAHALAPDMTGDSSPFPSSLGSMAANFPCGQEGHNAEPALEKAPTPHSTHVLGDTDPTTADALPAGHSKHSQLAKHDGPPMDVEQFPAIPAEQVDAHFAAVALLPDQMGV
jgi:hypothetical protein